MCDVNAGLKGFVKHILTTLYEHASTPYYENSYCTGIMPSSIRIENNSETHAKALQFLENCFRRNSASDVPLKCIANIAFRKTCLWDTKKQCVNHTLLPQDAIECLVPRFSTCSSIVELDKDGYGNS